MGKFNLTELLNARSQESARQETQWQDGAAKNEDGQQDKEVMMVDVRDLEPSKENFYHVDDSLKRSIELVGVLQPLLVKRPENGKYKVLAGHRRRMAVLALLEEGKEEFALVPCVYNKEDVRDRLAIIMANRFRDKTDWEKMQEAIEAEEIAKELKREYQIGGRTRAILEEITGVSEAQLGRYKAVYNNLIPELMLEFKENRIVFSVAVEASRLPKEWQRKAYGRLKEDGGLSLPDVRELKEAEAEETKEPEEGEEPEEIAVEEVQKEETADEPEREEQTYAEPECIEPKREAVRDVEQEQGKEPVPETVREDKKEEQEKEKTERKRLTKRSLLPDGGVICDTGGKGGLCNESCIYGRFECKWILEALLKLKEYEDLEEDGLLVRLK
jgi:ParB-like chromosome segregation protein Spo0J